MVVIQGFERMKDRHASEGKTQCFSDKARCADAKVFTSSIVMVIGPTPPGTGVM
jgi:hypothetical protein